MPIPSEILRRIEKAHKSRHYMVAIWYVDEDGDVQLQTTLVGFPAERLEQAVQVLDDTVVQGMGKRTPKRNKLAAFKQAFLPTGPNVTQDPIEQLKQSLPVRPRGTETGRMSCEHPNTTEVPKQ